MCFSPDRLYCTCNCVFVFVHVPCSNEQLRMMDPENRTPVLRAFCYKQLLNVMLVGGGLFTSSSLAISHTAGPWGLFAVSASGAGFWLVVLLSLRARGAFVGLERASGSTEPGGLSAPLLRGATT